MMDKRPKTDFADDAMAIGAPVALVPVEEAVREVRVQYVDFITGNAVVEYWREQLAERGQLVELPEHGLMH
jgi:hypothetical protein